jgi:putative ABC transport system ATP-binding protein
LPNPDLADTQPGEFLVVERLSKRFRSPGGDVDALVDVNASLPRGTLTVLAGPSGSGKSTLLMMIAAADRPDSGDVFVAGVSLSRLSRRERRHWRRDHLGIVMPQPSDNLTQRHDALGNLVWSSSLRSVGSPLGRETAADSLARVELDGLEAAPIAHLSGGQQMRLALTCASVGDPTLILVDEPTASLDAASAATVVRLLRRMADDGTTLVVATHDHAIVEAADQVVRLDRGRVVA